MTDIKNLAPPYHRMEKELISLDQNTTGQTTLTGVYLMRHISGMNTWNKKRWAGYFSTPDLRVKVCRKIIKLSHLCK